MQRNRSATDLNQRISSLSTRVTSLLSNCDQRLQTNRPLARTRAFTTTARTARTATATTARPPRRDHQIAREIQQVRNEVRLMSERADQRKNQLQSLLYRNRRPAEEKEQQQQPLQQHSTSRATQRTRLHAQDTHLNLSNTVPSLAHPRQPRTEMRAWLTDILSSAPTPKKGLSQEQLATLASKTLRSPLDTSCCICLEAMETGCVVTHLPCAHAFHTNCIRKWLSRSHSCPLCVVKVDL